MKKLIQFPFPVFIAKENKWFVSECPILNIATQGKTENEVKKNIEDLIKDCLQDPDTQKINLEPTYSSLNYISVPVPSTLLYGKA